MFRGDWTPRCGDVVWNARTFACFGAKMGQILKRGGSQRQTEIGPDVRQEQRLQ